MYYLLKEMKTNFNDQTDGVKAYSNTEYLWFDRVMFDRVRW